MVNVHDSGKLLDKVGREHLHILSQHHKIDIVLAQEFELVMLLVGFGVWRDRKIVVVDTKLIRDRFEVGVIANDQWDFGVQLSRLMSPQ